MEENNNGKKYIDKEQDRRLGVVEQHIATTNSEMGAIKVDIAGVKKDVAWLKRFFFIIATASIGGLIASVINLIQ